MIAAPLYRVLYVSRNRIPYAMQRTELSRILAGGRAANAWAGVTSALLCNRASFAQALEGSLPAVAATFERIQRDARHGDVMVLESIAVRERAFPGWPMAFAGEVAESEARLDPDTAEAARVLTLLRDLMCRTAEPAV